MIPDKICEYIIPDKICEYIIPDKICEYIIPDKICEYIIPDTRDNPRPWQLIWRFVISEPVGEQSLCPTVVLVELVS